MASVNNYFTPSELIGIDFSFDSNLASAYAKHVESDSGFGVDGRVALGRRSACFSLKGSMASDGIIAKPWSITKKDGTELKGTAYSFLMNLDDEADEIALEEITQLLENYCERVPNSSFDVLKVLKKGKVNIKLAVTGNKFESRFNSKRLRVSDLDNINELFTFDLPITVIGELNLRFAFEQEKASLVFDVRKIFFDGEIQSTPVVPTFEAPQVVPSRRVAKKSATTPQTVPDK